MSRYRQIFSLDDPIQEDGDNGFIGFNSRENSETLPPGVLSAAGNMRFDRKVAQVRKGLDKQTNAIDFGTDRPPLKLSFTLDSNAILGGTGGIRSSNLVMDSTGNEYIALILGDKLSLFQDGASSLINIAYPSGTTIDVNARPRLVQCLNRLFLFRGQSNPVLVKSDVGGLDFRETLRLSFRLSAQLSGDADFIQNNNVPAGDMAIAFRNRLVVVKDDYTLAFSDLLDPLTFDAANEFTFNKGDQDPIVSIAPFSENQIIVFKRHSIHLITNVDVVDSSGVMQSSVYEITRQHGLIARDSVAQIGDQVFYLSDNGVHSLTTGINANASTSTPVALLKVRNEPLSATIDPDIQNINFTAAQDNAHGVYHNNRYYLAVPTGTNTQNDSLYIYNTLNAAWESIDTFPSNTYLDRLIVMRKNGVGRLYATSQDGEVWLTEEKDFDEVGSVGNETQTPIAGTITTRRYTLQNIDIKRWHYGMLNWESTTSSDTVKVTVNTQNPDSTEDILTTSKSTGDFTNRFSLGRKRGYGLELKLTTSGGRPKIRSLVASGRVNLRSYTETV